MFTTRKNQHDEESFNEFLSTKRYSHRRHNAPSSECFLL